MDFVPLTSEQRRAFADDGFLVVPNALDRETVERLLNETDRLAEAFLRKPVVEGKPEYNHLDLRRGLLREQALFALVTNSTTVPLVVQLLGPNIHLHSTTIIYKRPETRDAPVFRRGWHRDIRMARDLGHHGLPLAGIKICYCLTDFEQPNSGMTLMARGTHLLAEPLRIPNGKVDPIDAEVCDLQLKAVAQASRPGAYLRIVGEGTLGAGDAVELLSRPSHGITVRDVADAILLDEELLARAASAPELPAALADWMRSRAA
jgi:hypothetical protein